MGFEIIRIRHDVDIDEEFICPICKGVLEDPLQVPACEHAFCRSCIAEWISEQPTCPVDRQPVTASQLRPISRVLRNLLSRLCTSCDNAPHGCNAVLQLDSLASHLVECEFNPKRPMPCEAGCGLVIPKDELAEHNCVRELRALNAIQQEKLNNYEQELAEHKRALNDCEQELAEHKRELALLKESKREMRLSNPSSTRELPDQMERDEVIRWANSLERVKVPLRAPAYFSPDDASQVRIKRSLSESGCPPHIIDDLVKNCCDERWPAGIKTSLLTDRRLCDKNVCRRLPGQRAILFLHCDNTHVNEHKMSVVEPGIVVIFSQQTKKRRNVKN